MSSSGKHWLAMKKIRKHWLIIKKISRVVWYQLIEVNQRGQNYNHFFYHELYCYINSWWSRDSYQAKVLFPYLSNSLHDLVIYFVQLSLWLLVKLCPFIVSLLLVIYQTPTLLHFHFHFHFHCKNHKLKRTTNLAFAW